MTAETKLAAKGTMLPILTSPAAGSVGKKFDVFHSFPQLIEDRYPTFEQRRSVNCRFGTMTVAFKQAYAKHMFQVGNDLRYDWLGNGEMLRRLRHAFALYHSK